MMMYKMYITQWKRLLMSKLKTYFALFFLFLFNCSESKKSNTTDNKMTVITDSSYIEWMIGKDFKIWKPNDSDLQIVDDVLISAIDNGEFFFLENECLSEIRKYYRQYLCYINEKGEKIIFINSMCELDTAYDENNNPTVFDWKNEMIDIDDGGDCYWKIKINLTTNKHFGLMINMIG